MMPNETDKLPEETYESKVAEARGHLRDYLQASQKIKDIQKELSIPSLKPEQREPLNNNLVEHQVKQQEAVNKVNSEHQVNIAERLTEGKSPLSIMTELKNVIEQKYPKPESPKVQWKDTSDDRTQEMQMEHPINPPAIDLAKLAKDRKEEAEKPKEEQKPQEPLVSETLTVTHHVAPHRAIDRFLRHEEERKHHQQKESAQEPRRGHKHDM